MSTRREGEAMKCEHEGCLKEATHMIEIRKIGEPVYRNGKKVPALCDEHAAHMMRSRADEVEGVRDCETCEGEGYVGTYEDYEKCGCCHGTGKVPR